MNLDGAKALNDAKADLEGIAMPNPFKPTAGANPPLLVGRDDLIEEFAESIEDAPGAPMRLSIFTGRRGVGKTARRRVHADGGGPGVPERGHHALQVSDVHGGIGLPAVAGFDVEPPGVARGGARHGQRGLLGVES